MDREDVWTIGIIDDMEGERADIQVAILENVENKDNIYFKEYEVEYCEKEKLFQEIMEDISEEKIHTLIVDYRLDTAQAVIKGWEIVDYLHEEVPEFPVIIMTNVPDESKESPCIDADKIYPKIIFLDTRHELNPGMVDNIMRNIQRYIKRRKNLEGHLALELEKMDLDSTNEEVIRNVIQLERELGKYRETDQTILDQTFDMGELREVLQELRDIEHMLGEA